MSFEQKPETEQDTQSLPSEDVKPLKIPMDPEKWETLSDVELEAGIEHFDGLLTKLKDIFGSRQKDRDYRAFLERVGGEDELYMGKLLKLDRVYKGEHKIVVGVLFNRTVAGVNVFQAADAADLEAAGSEAAVKYPNGAELVFVKYKNAIGAVTDEPNGNINTISNKKGNRYYNESTLAAKDVERIKVLQQALNAK